MTGRAAGGVHPRRRGATFQAPTVREKQRTLAGVAETSRRDLCLQSVISILIVPSCIASF